MAEKTSEEFKNSSLRTAKAAKGVKKGASLASKAVRTARKKGVFTILSTPAGRCAVIGVIVLVLIMSLLSEGLPATSTNSFTHINENQDAIAESVGENSDYDNLDSARRAEAEGINILGGLLKEEKVEMEQKLKELCEKEGVNYEATLQMLDANFVELGSASYEQHAEGTYSQEEYDASVLLSAYSISVDNLWGESSETSGNTGALDLSSIDISTEEGKALYIYVKLRTEGYCHEAACGVLGNLSCETTGFNASSINSTAHIGIVQWGGGRAAKLKKYAKSKGAKWNDFITQVDFMIREIKGSYKKSVYDKLMAEGVSLSAATDVVLRSYEAPGNYTVEFKNRYAVAKKWDKKFKSVDPGAYVSSPASASTNLNPDDFYGTVQYAGCGRSGIYISKYKNRGWTTLLRPKNPATAIGIANAARQANKYKNVPPVKFNTDKQKRQTFYKESEKVNFDFSKVHKKCYSSCSSFASVCARAGGVPKKYAPALVYSDSLPKRLISSGLYEEYKGKKYANNPDFWQPGDLLVLKGAHCYTVVQSKNKLKLTGSASASNTGLGTVTVSKAPKGSAAASDPAGSVKTYKSYKSIATIGSGDVDKYLDAKGINGYVNSQAISWLGNGQLVIAMCNGGAKNKCMLVKYKDKKEVAHQQSSSARHGNGMCYNEKTGTIYVARAALGGGDRHILTKFASDTLKETGTKKLKGVTTSSIGYDLATDRYILQQHNKIILLDANFKVIKRVSRKKNLKPQDSNCFNGVAFCVTQGSADIELYRMSDGAYLGTIKTNLGEIESVCIDDEGHMLLINQRRNVYITKKTISQYIGISDTQADSSGGTDEERDYNEDVVQGRGFVKAERNSSQTHSHNIRATKLGAVKMSENWRIDLSKKFKKYLEKNEYYTITLDEDEKGNTVVYDGTIDANADEAEKTEELKDNVDENIVDDGKEKNGLENLTDTEKGDEYKDYLQSSLPGADAAREDNDKRVNQKKKPKLKAASYIKADLFKTDVAEAALTAFKVRRADVTEHYGKNVTRRDALDQMAKASIAMLHDVDDFNLDLYTEELDADYKVSEKAIGKYKITSYCACESEEECLKNNQKLLGRRILSKNTKRTAGVTCAAPKNIPIGTILYIKKLDRIVVVDEHLNRSAGDNLIAIYTGKKHENWTKRKKEFEKEGEIGAFLVTGITPAQAKSLGYGVAGAMKEKRTQYPDLNNPYYFSGKYNPFVGTRYGPPSIYHNCTWYAFGRFSEILGKKASLPTGNAGTWYRDCTAYKKGKTPALGAVIVWTYPGGGAGHVAVVEEIKSNGDIVTSNSAWNGGGNRSAHTFFMETIKKSNGYNYPGRSFQGFIYQP